MANQVFYIHNISTIYPFRLLTKPNYYEIFPLFIMLFSDYYGYFL